MPQAQVNRKTKTKIANGTLHGLTHHAVKVSQREKTNLLHLLDAHF